MMPPNPTMPVDPMYNPLTPTMDQMSFIYTYYPEYAANPIDLIIWLFEYAKFNEDQVRMMKSALEGNQDPYSQPPKNKHSKVKGKKNKNGEDDEEEEEEVTYLNMRDLRKKKPEPSK